MSGLWRITLCCLLACSCARDAADPPPRPAIDQLFPIDGDVAGSQILIAWKSASHAPPEIERTREEALTKAQQLAVALQDDPSLFEELARQESDGPAAARGGRLGGWQAGALTEELNLAYAALAEGAITPQPVESAFGWHILRRDSLCRPHYGFEAFYIAFKGSEETPAAIRRNRDEALALAREAAAALTPQNFTLTARKFNDFADGPLPVEVISGIEHLPKELFSALGNLDFGGVAGPIELPVGFGFFRRVELEKRAGAHILISFIEARAADPHVSRTRREAGELAAELLDRLAKNPAAFEDLAREFSDEPKRENKGARTVWFRGKMPEPFEAAMDNLAPGEISRTPIESAYGYHIIRADAFSNPCDGQ